MSEFGAKHYRTSLIVGGHSGGHRRKLLQILDNKTYAKVRKTPYFVAKYGVFGGDKRDRTADLLNAIQEKTIAAQGFFAHLVVIWWS